MSTEPADPYSHTMDIKYGSGNNDSSSEVHIPFQLDPNCSEWVAGGM